MKKFFRLFFVYLFSSVILLNLAALIAPYYLNESNWFLSIASHLRVLSIYIISICFVFLLLLRQWFNVFIYLLLGFYFLAFYYFDHQEKLFQEKYFPVARQYTRINARFISFNLNFHNRHYEEVKQFLLEQIDPKKDTVIFLSEVTQKWEEELKDLIELFPNIITGARPDGFGYMLLSTARLFDSKKFNIKDVPLIRTQIEFKKGQVITFWGVHAPPPINPFFYGKQVEYLQELKAQSNVQTDPQIIVGDFNATPWSKVFKEVIAGNNKPTPIFNYANSETYPQNTWNIGPEFLGFPIDHVLYDHLFKLHHFHVRGKFGSDHNAIVADFL